MAGFQEAEAARAWLPNYLKVWGPVAGLANFVRVAQVAAADARDPVSVPRSALSCNAWVRAALHGIDIFQQALIKRGYDIRETPQFEAVQRAYETDLAAGRT